MGLWQSASNWVDKIDTISDQLNEFRDDVNEIIPKSDSRGVKQPRAPGIPGLPDNIAVNPKVILGAKIAAAAVGVLVLVLVIRQ